MSKKSNSKPQEIIEDTNNNIEELSEDQDFGNIESDPNEIDASSEELEGIDNLLLDRIREQPFKSPSEQEIVMKFPDEKDIISSLDLHKSSKKAEELPDIANKNVDELLASATAEMKAEQAGKEGIQVTPKPQHVRQKAKDEKSPAEKIATLACYLAIVALFTYLIMYASNQHDFSTAMGYEANTPVDGDYASVEKIETWWSKPAGNNTKFGVILVPSATITLGENSKSGVTRSVFYSYEEGLIGELRPKGDPFTHEFKDGKFLESGTNQITIHGTDGYSELAHFMYYRSQDENRWTVDVKEAPSTQTDINSFKSLAQAPIEPIRK